MKKQIKTKRIIITLCLAIIITFLFLVFLLLNQKSSVVGRAITDITTKEVKLSFYDEDTSCKLNGKVYLDDNILGESKNGILTLKENEVNNISLNGTNLHILGTTDLCFGGNNKNLTLEEYWKVNTLDFFKYDTVFFKAKITPRKPRYYEEMQGFVIPSEVKDYLSKLNLKNNTGEDLDKINEYKVRYRSDILQFNESDYWQTPLETMNKKYGDCEDWAVTVLSMMRSYNSSLKCYAVVWETHVSIFCYYNGNYIIYDQEKIKYSKRLNKDFNEFQNKFILKDMLNKYFDGYGIPNNERKVHALFNENETITFNSNDEFIDWMYNLSK
jgi:hypothetical protein